MTEETQPVDSERIVEAAESSDKFREISDKLDRGEELTSEEDEWLEGFLENVLLGDEAVSDEDIEAAANIISEYGV
jgi:hypothetical protein